MKLNCGIGQVKVNILLLSVGQMSAADLSLAKSLNGLKFKKWQDDIMNFGFKKLH